MMEIWVRLQIRLFNVRKHLLRTTMMPALIRFGIFVAGVAALHIAHPATWWVSVLAIVPAMFPRSMWVTFFILLAVFWWVDSTATDHRLTTWRLCALAIALYLVHVGCALSAVLPYDAVYTRGVFRPWLVRAGIVSVLTVGFATVAGAVPHAITTAQPLLPATIGGIVLMVATAIFIAYLGFRRQ
jgi:hypothetical protein